MAQERRHLLDLQTGSWREALAAMAPFLLLGILPALLGLLKLPFIHSPAGGLLFSGMLGLLSLICLVGMTRGLPRWVLPQLGLALSISCFLSTRLLRAFLSRLCAIVAGEGSPWLVRQIAYEGRSWAVLLMAVLFIVALTAALPPLRAFYERVRRDWTLLSFGLYGSALLTLLVTFESYVNEEPYLIAAVSILIAGGWLYLRGTERGRRGLILFTALTLAMGVAAVGKALLFSGTGWPYARGTSTWWTEAVSTIISWGWLVAAICAPMLLSLLPSRRKPACVASG